MNMKIALAAVALALGPVPAALAWDSHGHMMVAEIAWRHLTPAAKGRVGVLLKLNPNYATWTAGVAAGDADHIAFVIAATWPDEIKGDPNYTFDGEHPSGQPTDGQNIGYADKLQHRYWHFIDTPFSTDGTALVQPVAPNAQTQIEAFTSAIASNASDDIKSYDLVWLEHLVGDVHQPLHATSRFSSGMAAGDQGGNLVTLQASGSAKLHAFWDDVLGSEPLTTPPATIAAQAIPQADALPAPPAAKAAITDDAVWIKESFKAAKQYAYASPIGNGAGPYTLSTTYKTHAKKQARIRVELAGVRLANLINTNLH
jgi:hypothetical protein